MGAERAAAEGGDRGKSRDSEDRVEFDEQGNLAGMELEKQLLVNGR